MRIAKPNSLIALVAACALSVAFQGGGNRRAEGGGEEAAEDWTSSFLAVWSLDEATDATRLNASTASCGTDCDLSDNNGVAQDTTNFIEGAASAYFETGAVDYLECTRETCDELTFIQPISFGCWAGDDQAQGNNGRVIHNEDNTGNGWSLFHLRFGSPNYNYNCNVGDGQTNGDTGSGDEELNHVVCTYANDADDEINLYFNGEVDATPATTTDNTAITVSEGDFSISDNSGAWDWYGSIDECFVIDVELTASQVCRICSCGIDGSECSCSGSTYVDAGRNASHCGECTMTDCDALGP